MRAGNGSKPSYMCGAYLLTKRSLYGIVRRINGHWLAVIAADGKRPDKENLKKVLFMDNTYHKMKNEGRALESLWITISLPGCINP